MKSGNSDKLKNAVQADQQAKAAERAAYSQKLANKQLDALVERAAGPKKPRALAQKFRDAAAVGGATKDHPGDGIIRAVDIPEAREKFGIPKPQKPGNEFGGWKDHAGNPVDFFRGDAKKERPKGSKVAGGMNADKLLKTLADDRTWKEDPKRKAPADVKPEFYKMLTQLSRHADSAAAQFGRLDTTGKPTDVALTLSVMGREGRNGITSDSKKIDSYRHFGLDDLYSDQAVLKGKGYLPGDFPDLKKGDGGSWPAKWDGIVYNEVGQRNASIKELVVRITGQGKTTGEAFDIIEKTILPKSPMGKKLGPEGIRTFTENFRKGISEGDVQLWRQTLESGLRKAPGLGEKDRWRALLPLEGAHEVKPAMVPGDRLIEVTGAKLNHCRDRFQEKAEAAGFSREEIGSISKDEQRAWTAMDFMAPGYTKDLLKQIKSDRSDLKSLHDILTVQTDNDYIKGARVRAAEAYLIEKHVLREPWE